MRTKHAVSGLVALSLLVAAHWAYWYRPRERSGVPGVETVPGRIFVGSELPYRVWLPYPHQNLAELERALGDVEELMRSVARLSGRPMPRMPSFGAARVPPSSELVLATDESGESFIAAAKVYPMPGLLARWAGRLAGNPLLVGGRSEIDGRAVDVSWVDRTWIVASAGVAPPASAVGSERSDAALAWLRLTAPRGRLPAGEYRLRREEGDLLLQGGDPATLGELERLASLQAPLPVLTVQSFRSEGAFGARALGLVSGVDSIGGLPGAASAFLGSRRWRLPGERILDLVGDGAPSLEIGGWRVVALEEDSLSRGGAIVEFSRRLEGHSPLSVALWIELREARRLVDQVAAALEEVPIIGRREARRWHAASSVLTPLARYQRLTAFVSLEPAAVAVRLEQADGAAN